MFLPLHVLSLFTSFYSFSLNLLSLVVSYLRFLTCFCAYFLFLSHLSIYVCDNGSCFTRVLCCNSFWL